MCSQSAISNVFAAGEDDVTMQQTDHTVSIEYLTLQPGERDDSVNFNWYAPEGTKNAIVRMGDTTVEASVRALHTPTKVVEGKYGMSSHGFGPCKGDGLCVSDFL